jgi:hypothetical protein
MWPRSDDEVVTGICDEIGGVIEVDDGERRVEGSDLKLDAD